MNFGYFFKQLNFSLKGSSAAKKGILIGVVLISVNQLSGLFAFLNYTADIFIEAGSTFSPNTSAVIVGLLLFIGSLFSLLIVDKFSRKLLYSMTTVGNIIGLMTMGIYSYCKTFTDVSSFKYVPVASLSLIIFAASSGRLPLTYIMMAEIMPQSIRSFGVSTCTVTNWILAFVLLRFFSTIVEILQLHVCMFIFSGFTLFGMIFVILYVPETKNRSFDEIENSLIGRKRNYESTENQELKNFENEKRKTLIEKKYCQLFNKLIKKFHFMQNALSAKYSGMITNQFSILIPLIVKCSTNCSRIPQACFRCWCFPFSNELSNISLQFSFGLL